MEETFEVPTTKKELEVFSQDMLERYLELETKLNAKNALAEDRYNEIRRQNRNLGKQQAEIEELNEILNLLRSIEDAAPPIPTWMEKPINDGGIKKGIPTLFLSDLHLGETVNPHEMQFYNAYNREIAEQRMQHTIDTALMLCDDYVSGIDFDGFCLPLGGDILSGDIHMELAKTNADTVFDEIVHWVPILASAIMRVHERYGKVYLPCVVGNHDRNPANHRTPAKRRAKDALTWVIYHWLQDKLGDVEGIQFQITESMDLSYKLYDTTYLLTHGDQFSGGSGIAGIYCLGEDTQILTSSLEWKKLGETKVGESIIGFDEEPGDRGKGRQFKEAFITSNDPVYLPSSIVKTDIGDTLASDQHMWLVRRNHSVSWLSTTELVEGDTIMSVGKPWSYDESREAGWLAGVYDGEGCIEQSGRLSVAQNPGFVLSELKDLLDEREYDYSLQSSNHSDTMNLRAANGKAMIQNMRLIGSIRPERLIRQSNKIWDGNSTKACSVSVVQSVTSVGEQRLIAVGTSTKTLIADGLLSHNSPIMKGHYKKQLQQLAFNEHYFDWMIMGHFHQLIWGQGIIVNGSMKGYDEYALSKAFTPEEPKQALWITTPERGITMKMDVFCSPENENWEVDFNEESEIYEMKGE